MKRSILIIFVILCVHGFGLANQENIDTLKVQYHHATSDSLKLKYALSLGRLLLNEDITKSLSYFEKTVLHFEAEAQRLPNDTVYLYKNKLRINLGRATASSYVGGFKENIDLLTEALIYAHYLKDSHAESSIYTSLANIQEKQGNYTEALFYYKKALKVAFTTESQEGIGASLGNIGAFYEQVNADSALHYYQRALVHFERIPDARAKTSAMAWLYNQFGIVYVQLNRLDSAQVFYLKSLEMRQNINHYLGQYLVMKDIAELAYFKGEHGRAMTYINQSITIGEEKGYSAYLEASYFLRSRLYEEKGKYKLALEDYQKGIAIRDSIINKDNSLSALRESMAFQFKQRSLIDSLNNVTAHRIKDLEIAEQKASIEVQKTQKYALFAGLGLVIVLLLIFFNANIQKRKQNQIITTQKEEVENQNKKIKKQHQEITDSIAYAKRIQNAILPPDRVVKAYLNNSLILYKPKDIVAGDFYWMEHKDDAVLFAAADCTGHGVPGAMISVVCNNALNRSVREYNLTDPGQILDKTRELVIEEFVKSDEKVNDGMDIALCALKGNTLKYAGAHNPLWLFRDGELIETKADKEPIGQYSQLSNYTTHQFELKPGDTIYIFSDGFADQFGGEKGKKYKIKAFKTLLANIQNQTMAEQRRAINDAFESWKGDLEQIDDVCIIGVKI